MTMVIITKLTAEITIMKIIIMTKTAMIIIMDITAMIIMKIAAKIIINSKDYDVAKIFI